MKKKSPYLKYRNPNKCSYPWSDNLAGYCWGYAEMVDGKKSKEEIEKMCKGCEFYKSSKNRKEENKNN